MFFFCDFLFVRNVFGEMIFESQTCRVEIIPVGCEKNMKDQQLGWNQQNLLQQISESCSPNPFVEDMQKKGGTRRPQVLPRNMGL